MNKKQRVGLIIIDGKRICFKEIFKKIFRERFDEITELTNETNSEYFICCFKSDISLKRFKDFEKGTKLFEKIKSGNMKLEEAKKKKKLNVFKSSLHEIKNAFQSTRLPITLAQVKSGNTPENLLEEIYQTIYSLYQAIKVIRKIYNNIMNLI